MLIFREMFFNIIVTVQLKKQRIVDIEMVDFFLENENCKKTSSLPWNKVWLIVDMRHKGFFFVRQKSGQWVFFVAP